MMHGPINMRLTVLCFDRPFLHPFLLNMCSDFCFLFVTCFLSNVFVVCRKAYVHGMCVFVIFRLLEYATDCFA